MTHPDAIGGHFPERLAVRRFSPGERQKKMERLAVKARRETAAAKKRAGRQPTCECGQCRKCKQREIGRAFEARNPDRKKVTPAKTIAENATVRENLTVAPREPLSTAPEIAFLDRLIASNWGDVPRVLLPECVVAAVEAGALPPEPSFEIQWAADRSPGSLAAAIEKWMEARV